MEFDENIIVYRSNFVPISNKHRPLVKVHPEFGGQNMIHVSIPLPKEL
jgi:hypothetical protein